MGGEDSVEMEEAFLFSQSYDYSSVISLPIMPCLYYLLSNIQPRPICICLLRLAFVGSFHLLGQYDDKSCVYVAVSCVFYKIRLFTEIELLFLRVCLAEKEIAFDCPYILYAYTTLLIIVLVIEYLFQKTYLRCNRQVVVYFLYKSINPFYNLLSPKRKVQNTQNKYLKNNLLPKSVKKRKVQ